MIAKARAALEAAEAGPVRQSARLIALRDFGYQNRRTRETVSVARGQVVDARELTEHGNNIRKLVDNKFVRREDEA